MESPARAVRRSDSTSVASSAHGLQNTNEKTKGGGVNSNPGLELPSPKPLEPTYSRPFGLSNGSFSPSMLFSLSGRQPIKKPELPRVPDSEVWVYQVQMRAFRVVCAFFTNKLKIYGYVPAAV